MKKKSPAKKKTASAKSTKCTNPVCVLMTGPKGRAFGKAGSAFYGEYLKIAKKEKNKAAVEDLSHAVVEMAAMAKGKLCACSPEGCDCECAGEGCCC